MDDLQKLQQLLLKIPKGRVTTYKEIARAMEIKGYRYTGQLLNKNPEPDRYPCYKVVRSDGSLGGFSKGLNNKIKRLAADGIRVKKGKLIGFHQKLYQFFV